MLILEIALGIVLAVLILAFWPVIIGAGVVIVLAGAAIAVLIFGYLFFMEQGALWIPLVIGIILLIAYEEKKKVSTPLDRAGKGYDSPPPPAD
jgi:hypothetical protein